MIDHRDLIYVRVTVKMQGVSPGDHVWVDPDNPKIRDLLIGGPGGPYLVAADESAATAHG